MKSYGDSSSNSGVPFEVSALGSDVGLGVGSLSAGWGTEMSLGFSVFGSSQEQCVGSY